jgi:hypothetical protein
MRFKLEKGLATKELSQLIPIENIVAYLLIYYEMKETEIKKYADITPEAEIETIRKSLESLVKKGYLSKELLKRFIGELIKAMMKTDVAVESFVSHDLKKEGFPEDRALNFLIYALIYDCKHYTNKQNYEVVAEFLQEQKIAKLEYYDLGKRYRRLNKDTIKEYLKNYLIVSDRLRNVINSIGSSEESTIKVGFLSQCAFEIVSELSSKTPITN